MIKKLIAFVAILMIANANAAVIHPDWKFAENGLLQVSGDENQERLNATFTRLAAYQAGLLSSIEPALGVISPCYQDNDWCNQHGIRQVTPMKNTMAYPYAYSHYAIADWAIHNRPTPVAEPVTVLLLFIGFVLLFFRNLRNRIKEPHLHK